MANTLSRISVSILLVSITIPLVLLATTSAHQFTVGGPMNWTVPSGQDSDDFYNLWASENRFHVGDFLYFGYEGDSVLVVSRADYTQCNVSNPILMFRDGQTQFRFDRYGFFFFISGEPGHCTAGQRMIVRVMVHPDDPLTPPAMSPSAYAPGPYTDGPALSPASPPTTGLVPTPHPRHSGGLKLSPFIWAVSVILGALFVVILLI